MKPRRASPVLVLGCLAACGVSDAATRLAYDIEAAAGALEDVEGARYRLIHSQPSKRGECTGAYKVQLDEAGAIIFWCRDASGQVAWSPATSYHRRFVRTERTFILDKPAGSALEIELSRVNGEAVITNVR